MKRLSALLLLSATATAHAQTPGDTLVMSFEGGATLALDSVYPAGCWQVGAPNKPLFTAALSLPNALVTDTVLPHPANTTCYAEFTLLADESMWYWGRWFEFDQWIDLAPGSHAWIEARDTWMSDWARLNDGWYLSGSTFFAPEGYEFLPSTGGWEHVIFDSPCIGVMDGGNERWYDPLMRIRFVLTAADNIDGHDGWMIDNFRATATICTGGMDEQGIAELRAWPNPASERLTIDIDPMMGPASVELFRQDGALVRKQPTAVARTVIDLGGLPEGPYFLRALGNTARTATIVIAR